jgi:hypothetical protein
MENNNKLQWLIDAENEINNAANTKYGKMSDKEFRFSEKQSNAGKAGGKITGPIQGKRNVESGHLQSLRSTDHQINAGKNGGKRNMQLHKEDLLASAAKWKLNNPEKQKQLGVKMNENMDPEFRKEHNTKVANKIYIMSDGLVLKTPFVKSKYEKENQGVSVVASYVQGDDEYDYYHNIIIERKEQARLDKLKSKPCKHCGTECKPRGLYAHEKNCKSKTK